MWAPDDLTKDLKQILYRDFARSTNPHAKPQSSDNIRLEVKGGGMFQILTPPPPPPSGPPKVFEPVFLQIEILGKMGGASGNIFAGMRHALKLLNPPPYVCIL